MVKVVQQYEVYWISLEPALGSEMTKKRPCVIVSPDEMNQYLRTVVIVPVTSTIKNYPWRLKCVIDGRDGSIAIDQIKTVDKARIGPKVGELSQEEIGALKEIIQKMLVD